MATLVLTTVGGAIGGPVGAAIGAMLGQGIDRNVLFPSPRRVGPRLTELAVQTSSYGTPIPRIFGTMRVAGSVIWATDLIETRSNGRGGKGRPATTSYSYAASFAVALSSRPILAVRRIWAEGKLLRGAAGDWKSATGFRLHHGSEEQAPDPLIASLVPDAPAHRGIAYAVFEELLLADFGNRIPSLTFEVVADEAPVPIGAVARSIGEGVVTGAGPADTVAGFAASGSSVAGALEVLQDIAQAWVVPDGGALRLENRVGTVRDVDPDGAADLMRDPVETVPVALSVSHHDPARDYQLGVQHARRVGAGWRDEALALPAVLSAGMARGIAEGVLATRLRTRTRRRATLDIAALALAPGDAVRLPGEAGPWRVARSEVEGMEVTLDLLPAGDPIAARAADPGTVAAAPDVAAGTTILAAFELPPLDDVPSQVPQLAIAATGTAPGWRGAALAVSRDGASWDAIGGSAAPAVIGTLAGPLGAASAALVDRRHAVELILPHGEMALASADAAGLDRGANLAMIGDELVQFGEVVALAPRRWHIATLLRGRRGTVPAHHPAGTRFVLIERDALLVLPMAGLAVGDTVRVVAQSPGDGDAGPHTEAAFSGVSIAPPAPVRLEALPLPDGALRVGWVRRSRLGWQWRDGQDAPLVEENERYRVRWSHNGNAREAIVAASEIVIPAALAPDGPLTVCQLGTFATSPAATITI